jgi:hypothetical protein
VRVASIYELALFCNFRGARLVQQRSLRTEDGRLYSSAIEGSKHGLIRELRVQSGGKPLHGFYAFKPRRTAVLLSHDVTRNNVRLIK